MKIQISPKQAEALLVLAEELHFGRAAERLGIAQPQLSDLIRRLEEVAGLPVFVRRPQVRLTPGGAALAATIQRVSKEIDEGIEEARAIASGDAGSVSCGYSGTTLFTHIGRNIARFRADNRAVRLRLREDTSAAVLAMLNQGQLDLAVCREPAKASSANSVQVLSEKWLLIAPQNHWCANVATVRLAELQSENFLLPATKYAPEYMSSVVRSWSDAGLNPNVIQVTETWAASLALVRAGLGVSFATESMRDLGFSEVTYCAIADPLPSMPLWVSYFPSRLTPAGERLLSAILAPPDPED
ncbi:MAG TPA: LysR family transcriptional regulator [Allosphingosinicella sp.]|jgi:DNA-binding transcriptional LysR family regulator